MENKQKALAKWQLPPEKATPKKKNRASDKSCGIHTNRQM